MVNKLFDKSLLEYNVVRNSVIFDPQVLVNENDKRLLEYNVVKNSVIFDPLVLVNENASVLQNKLKRLLTHLMKLKILTSVQCDKIT